MAALGGNCSGGVAVVQVRVESRQRRSGRAQRGPQHGHASQTWTQGQTHSADSLQQRGPMLASPKFRPGWAPQARFQRSSRRPARAKAKSVTTASKPTTKAPWIT